MAKPLNDRIMVRTPPIVTARLEEQAYRLGLSRSAYASMLLGQATLNAETVFKALPDALNGMAQSIAAADKEHDDTTP